MPIVKISKCCDEPVTHNVLVFEDEEIVLNPFLCPSCDKKCEVYEYDLMDSNAG
jgi:hypothetical protein